VVLARGISLRLRHSPTDEHESSNDNRGITHIYESIYRNMWLIYAIMRGVFARECTPKYVVAISVPTPSAISETALNFVRDEKNYENQIFFEKNSHYELSTSCEPNLQANPQLGRDVRQRDGHFPGVQGPKATRAALKNAHMTVISDHAPFYHVLCVVIGRVGYMCMVGVRRLWTQALG
jgi:hypothetical protein